VVGCSAGGSGIVAGGAGGVSAGAGVAGLAAWSCAWLAAGFSSALTAIGATARTIAKYPMKVRMTSSSLFKIKRLRHLVQCHPHLSPINP
jgi:hypothetical protein